MNLIADLHLHSKYSRAVSPQMTVPVMALWAKRKGIGLVAAPDWTHPLFLRELKEELKEVGEGVYAWKGDPTGPKFILVTEIASIFSQGGRGRRIHTLVFSPDFATADKICEKLRGRGANLFSDGRPITGIPVKELAEIVLSVSADCLVVPSHCLPSTEFIHTKDGIREIKDLKIGDFVYTHNNRLRRITKVFKRRFEGELYSIRPWYFSIGAKTTPEHPLYAFRVAYCPSSASRCLPTASHRRICRHNFYSQYRPEWIPAKKLTVGDILVFPRFTKTTKRATISLDQFSEPGGSRSHVFPQKIPITKEFCRLAGYYLAEGYTNGRDEIAFAFHRSERPYVDNVIFLMKFVFGISHHRIYQRKNGKSLEISFYSKVLVGFFQKFFYARAPYRAVTKTVPIWMMSLPRQFQAELLRGWWRGDLGYTSSRDLAAMMKIICLRLGIIPSISQDTREHHFRRGNHQYRERTIKASADSFVFTNLAFFEDPYRLLTDPALKNSVRKLTRRHGWIDKNYVYLPIRKIEKIPYKGEVFNLEVSEDNSYLAEFACVHNCWTPWFGTYGDKGGFDSLKEAYGDLADHIYAIETGMSSDPAMNWRVGELDSRSILSFSDAHSPAKLGREVTVFKLTERPSYQAIKKAIQAQEITYTIEFYPEEGKYHFTGHRKCGVSQSPEQTKKLGETCPVCGRPLTVGVMHRVEELATRTADEVKTKEVIIGNGVRGIGWGRRPPYVHLVPLMEILAESLETGFSSKGVLDEYNKLTDNFDSEFQVLLQTPIAEIAKIAGERTAEGVKKVREGNIVVEPGFDGVFGTVKIWSFDKAQDKPAKEQLGLF